VDFSQKEQEEKLGQSSFLVVAQSQFREEAYSSVKKVDDHFESMQKDSTHLEIFEILKKVVSGEYDISKFYDIYEDFLKSPLS
jgi:hypothetical protein